MTNTIPILQTRGTAYDVGFQIGGGARDLMHAMHAESLQEYGDRWQTLLTQCVPFQNATQQHLPRVWEEMCGVADGAQIPFDDLFLMSVEELLYDEVRGGVSPKGCSDIAAAPPATRDGHVWLGHNNDLGASSLEQLVLIRIQSANEPEIMAVTVGGWFISVGMNNAGIALTGNQLNANDSRAGIPRLLLVRDILSKTNVEDALASALHAERASSYNNIISARDGRIVNAEGSATAAAVTWSSDTGGTIAHTNHYLAETMLRFEADAEHVAMSATRCTRAFEYMQKYHGAIDYEICERFVCDHVYAPWSVCKHAGQSVTVFSTIMDVTEGKMWLARGNPCQNEFVLHEFA